MRLYGRESELAAIDALLADAHGFRSLLLVGEAGIGKSALLEAAAERARGTGMRVLAGRAAEHEGEVPFGLVIDALDDEAAAVAAPRLEAAGRELGHVLPAASSGGEPTAAAGPAERFRYHRALRAFVELLARETPTLLLLDDLQWADAASLEWALHMLRRPPAAHCALILATRPGDAAAQLLGAAPDEYLLLEPLGREASLALLEGVEREAARRIADDAGGNPLFLRELARAAGRSATQGLPATIAAAVRQEVERLGPDARRLLEGAAVAGDPFDPELAAAAAGERGTGEPLDALVAAGLVHAAEGPTFRFRHPLVRRAVYDGSPPGWRVAAHERAARLLRERGASPGQRAYHVERFALSGDREAIALLEQAAAADLDASPATAAHWYRAALRLLPGDATDDRARLLVPFGRALASTGRLAEALESLDEAIALGEGGVEVAAEAARVERELGRDHAAARRLRTAITTAAGGTERAMLETELVGVSHALGDAGGMLRHARAVLEHSPEDDPAARTIAAVMEAATATPDTGLVERAERSALELPAGSPPAPFDWAGSLAFTWEHYASAARLLERAVDAAVRGSQELALPRLRMTLALAFFYDLRPRAALEHAEVAEEIARLQDARVKAGLSASVRGQTLDVLGRPSEALAAAIESLRLLERAETTFLTTAAMTISLTVVHEHDPERLLDELLALFGDASDGITRPTTPLRTLVLAALATGRRAEAEAWIDAYAARAEQMRAGGVRVAVARAELMLADGEPERAVERARAAVRRADALDVRLDAARARVVLGRAFAAAGDRPKALAELERVVADAGAAGAERLSSEAARELRRLGARPTATAAAAAQRAAPGSPDGLSERERAIAELVAEGRSNKEVAAALFLSGKTIENNLSRIYAKLGVRSRTELARALGGR